MIRYALACLCGHGFEAWFSSSDGYEDQRARGLIACPECGSNTVRKQIMAPAISTGARPSRDGPDSDAAPADAPDAALAEMAAKVRAHVARNFVYVGDRFADAARQAHDRQANSEETAEKPIWGQASLAEVKALSEEGVPVAPLPEPFAPPVPPAPSKLN
jgi:hypothetical protein